MDRNLRWKNQINGKPWYYNSENNNDIWLFLQIETLLEAQKGYEALMLIENEFNEKKFDPIFIFQL